MSVYFITCRAVNMVKIGYAENASHVKARLIGLRTGCPLDLALEMVVPGGMAEEKALHELLKADRVRGEWFTITDTIERLITCPPIPDDYPDLERPYNEFDPHERLERIEAEKLRTQRSAAEVVQRSKEERIKRLTRELAADEPHSMLVKLKRDENAAYKREQRHHAAIREERANAFG